jgi:hypothetical protein
MSQADQSVEWYLARDGQQHGPISAAEMDKIIEFGYLLPTDLVWRQGFTDWKPASEAFPKPPETPPPAGPPPPTQSSAPAQNPARPADSATTPAGTKDPKAEAPRDRAHIAKDPASWEGEARRQAALRSSEPSGREASPQDKADRTAGTREIIAAEAARREETARRAREAAARQPNTSGPAGRQPAGGQARTEPGPRAEPTPAERGPQQTVGSATPPGAADDDAWADEPPRRRFPTIAIAAVVLLALIGGGIFALHATGQLDPIVSRVSSASAPQTSTPPLVTATPEARKPPQAAAGYASDPAEVDRQFQRSTLWELLKSEFPDWYRERVRDTARLKGEGKTDTAIAQHLAEQLVALRRKHVTDALSASPQHLKSVATTFLENLERLSQHSVDACYGFISQGETYPLIVELTRASEHTPSLQRQAAAIFSAIAEGRRTPAQHSQPTREDYDQLAMQLAKRGWSPTDLQLFSDARSLARAAPERVCRMVQDWFAAQLAVSDEEVKVRLLIEALKPVVAG